MADAAIGHEGFLRHARFRWLKLASVAAVAAVLLYALDSDPPGGGTAYGYITGTIAAALIVWLTMLGVRKRWMTRGRWSLKAWTSAHVWLGTALIVIGTLHTGFDFGWNIHTLAWVLMLVVIASGLVGIALYSVLPRALSDNRLELTETQMLAALEAADRQLAAAALPLDTEQSQWVAAALAEEPFARGPIARLTGRFPHRARDTALAQLAGTALAGPLARRSALLARIERHMRLKALLEGWLYVHVPATFALLAALTAHIVATFFYW